MVIFNCNGCGAATTKFNCDMCGREVVRAMRAIDKKILIKALEDSEEDIITTKAAEMIINLKGRVVIGTPMKALAIACTNCGDLNTINSYTCSKCGGVLSDSDKVQ